MSKKLFCISVTILSIIISCTHKPKITNYTIANNNVDISGSLNKKDSVSLSSVACDINYVQLQSDSSCYLGRILYHHEFVKFSDERIFISDENNLFCFDKKGKFLTQFGSKGRGPSEFVDFEGFVILEDKKQVAILTNALRKVMFFDFQGNHLRNIKIDFWPTSFSYFNNHLVFVSSSGRRHLTDYYTLSVMSLNGELIKRLIFRENEKQLEKKDKMKLGTNNQCYVMNNTLYYWEFNYDVIWEITTDFVATPQYSIFYGDDKIPFEYRLESKRAEWNVDFLRKHARSQAPTNTNRYIFVQIDNKGKLNRIYYDKKNKKSFCLRYHDKFVNKPKFGFFNDIDGGLPFWPQAMKSSNEVFMLFYGYKLK